MYKSFKLNKRVSFAIEKFRKTAKKISGVYNTGIYKKTDEINCSDTWFFVLGLYRLMIYIDHKHVCRQTPDRKL